MTTSSHPSVSILHLLTSRLRVRVSRRAMAAAVEAHPQPFSLACLRQALAQWRVRLAWFGSQQPVAPNNIPEGRAKNRRVEIKLISQ